MPHWDWLEKSSFDWRFMLRVVVKAMLLFVVINLIFALLQPMPTLGKLSLYNTVIPGRERLPYGENADLSYNLSLYNLSAMFAAHEVSTPRADDEFRVLLLGDSATWGWFLENEHTLATQINAGGYTTADGRQVVAYNLGYPIMSLTKDLLLLDYAMRYEPDMIVWLFTLESFPREKQLFPPLVRNDADRVHDLITAYDLDLNADDPRLNDPDFLDQTIVGERRALADLLRLQLYGFSWAATGIDQFIPEEYTLTTVDLSDEVAWEGIEQPRDLTRDDLAFDVLTAGIARAGEVPVLLVNEPMLVSDGENSDRRYNALFPRWAYDAYRDLLRTTAEQRGWTLLDMWNLLPSLEFTDSPVHLTPAGVATLAEQIAPVIIETASNR
jgi:hypothetical protein